MFASIQTFVLSSINISKAAKKNVLLDALVTCRPVGLGQLMTPGTEVEEEGSDLEGFIEEDDGSGDTSDDQESGTHSEASAEEVRKFILC